MKERLVKYFYFVFLPFRNVFMRLYLCLTDNSILSQLIIAHSLQTIPIYVIAWHILHLKYFPVYK